jgi:MYXO-CTERM domain-containing protein
MAWRSSGTCSTTPAPELPLLPLLLLLLLAALRLRPPLPAPAAMVSW